MPYRKSDCYRENPEWTRRSALRTLGVFGLSAVTGCIADARGQKPSDREAGPKSVWTPAFSRVERSGAYRLRYRWTAVGHRMLLEFPVSQDRYRSAVRRERSIPTCFDAALGDPLSARIARLLARQLDVEEVHAPLARLRAAIEFVRSIEYATDREATGELEYPKYVPETLVENGGDCEDLSFLLAGVLDATPFDYDPGLVFFSGHVGIGIESSAIDGDIDQTLQVGKRDYLYLDATIDVPFGKLPEEYREPGVIATYDGSWHLVNQVALKDHLVKTVSRGQIVDMGNYL